MGSPVVGSRHVEALHTLSLTGIVPAGHVAGTVPSTSGTAHCVRDSISTTELIFMRSCWRCVITSGQGVAAMMIAASTPTSAKMISATRTQLFFSQCRCRDPRRFPTFLASSDELRPRPLPAFPMRLSAFFFFARLEEEEEEDAVVAAGALLLEGWSGIPMLAATPAAGAAAVKALFFIIHELSAAFGMGSRQPRSGAAT